MDKLATAPLFVRDGAHYPFTEDLQSQFTRIDKYDESYTMYTLRGDNIVIPRNCAPLVNDERDPGRDVSFQNLFTPYYPEQAELVEQSVSLLKGDRSHILQAPTGAGKTYMGCAIAAQVGKRTLVMTTKEDILGQWVKAIEDVLGIPTEQIGIWRGDNVPDASSKITVGLIQSIRKGPERYGYDTYGGYGLLIADECHKVAPDAFQMSMFHVPAKLRLGLSATPERKDGKNAVLHGHIGYVDVVGKQETLIPKIIRRRSGWRIPGKKKNGKFVPMWHDYNRMAHVYKVMAKNAARNQEIVDFSLTAYEKKRHLIIFSNFIDHLTRLEEMLLSQGVDPKDIGYYVGLSANKHGKGSPEKKKALREEHAQRLIVLATFSMMGEGSDIPVLSTAVLGTPRSDVVQIVGRIRRFHPGKPQPVVLDLLDEGSIVLKKFADKRLRWYEELGCEIVNY